jgi:hypothetical protein
MMSKDDLQKELQEKIKEGIKPSDLKNSRSVDDLTAVKEQQEQQQIITDLQEQIAALTNSKQIIQNRLEAKDKKFQESQELVKSLTAENEKLLEARLSKLNEPN